MLNPYFQQGARSEQNLVQDLINEQLRMYGVEIYYLPRKYMTENTVIREVIESKFDDAYPLEAYIDNYDGYAENPVLLSKFGIEAQNEITLVVSRERWETYIQPLMENESNVKLTSRPKEGDIVYFPLGDRLFEIKYVEHEKPFYQLQKNYTYTLRCELFRYEDEVIDTGVEEIDDELTGDNSDGTAGVDDSISTILGSTQTLTLVGTGVTATALTNIVDGYIRSISLSNRGGGYTSIPTVGVSSAPSGGITGIPTASMIGGIQYCNLNINSNQKSVQAINLVNSGAGYTVAPYVTITGGKGSGAIASAGIGTTGGVGVVTVSGSGSGYVVAPTVTFSTPTHVGAAATAILDTPMVGGGVSITSAVISIGSSSYLFPGGTTGGVFYKKAPTITFSLPTGSGNIATATATLDSWALTGGTVESVAINTGGRFYTSAPTVTFSAPTGSFGAVATVGLAGSSIDPGSVAFTTTGRSYTTAPTVAISTSGTQLAPLVVSVGIATIHPITGIVTAVGFNSTTDPWCVGTGATIGLGYTVAPSITFSGATSQYRATGTATIDADGQVDAVSVATSGYGYDAAPTVTISAPAGGSEEFRALGFTTIRYNSIETSGTLGIGSTIITGITTTNILVGDRIRLASEYDNPLVNFIESDTYVSQIGVSTIYMSSTSSNVGIATSAFEFGIDKCGIVTGIGITYGGGGYLEPPTVSISNTEGDKNYVDIAAGIHTATGISTITSGGSVAGIWISDAGHGYILTPTVTLSDPSMDSTGNFVFNEIVEGQTSGTTARVKTWNSTTNTLEVGTVAGTFALGEYIVGKSSGASHKLRLLDTDPLDDGFADNKTIETVADTILDFTEGNPFGNP